VQKINMVDIQSRLKSVVPIIQELLKISGSAGLSLGVLHQNEIIYTANFGHQDVANQVCPTSDTLYWVGSIAKSMTAAAIGALVEDGKLQWESRVFEILPEFQHQDPEIRDKVTVVDLLTHKSGLGGKAGIWQRDHARVMISRENFLKTTTYLPAIDKVGAVWSPSNWNYGLADTIIEKVTGISYGAFIENRFLKPLSLERTTTNVRPELDNIANAYFCSENEGKVPYQTGQPQVGDGTIMVGAMGLKSTVNDLLTYCSAFMNAWQDQINTNNTTTIDSPFAQMNMLMKPHISIDSRIEGTPKADFTMGWVRTRLPNTMSEMGINEFYVEQFPIIGKGLENGPEVYYTAGSVVGFLTSVTLIPETKSAIVVTSNTLGNQDLPDWVGLLLLEALLDVPEPVDFIPYAKEAATTWSKGFPEMKKGLDEGRNLETPMRSPHAYVGQYWNEVGTWYFDIFQESDNSLWMAYCDDRANKYRLQHYSDDTLTYEIDYEESVKRGLWPVPSADFYLLNFQGENRDGKMNSILWKYDWQEPNGEIFTRRDRPKDVKQSILGEL
jgi:CubicO group peptidase (beta-lactamase class C family)